MTNTKKQESVATLSCMNLALTLIIDLKSNELIV